MAQRTSVIVASVAFGVIGLGVYLGARVGLSERGAPARCGAGLIERGPRCCAKGQYLEQGRCAGEPDACPTTMERSKHGCFARPRQVALSGATVHVGPDDWHGAVRSVESVDVADFVLDVYEVTHERWAACAATADCRKLTSAEPGAPVTGISPKEAEAFCRFEGGRLPSRAEFWRAARGTDGRRFPWGATGLVCRRAAFGLTGGPCATGGTSPDLTGSRPDGASVDGIHDLSGNVAEWTRDPSGRAIARGGSFRSEVAAELGSLSEGGSQPSDDIGFRCAYR